ncbi:MAG: hypothetical protein GXO00_01085 [Candidatus Diapherotrites archaeon]|nr:hypothetical protein [Candidatus Diapherotrites archaeon]
MEKVYEGTGVCPVCGKKSFHVQMFRYDLPTEGPSILFVGRCSSCGARVADVIPLEYGEEKTLEFSLPEDLNKILFLPGDTDVEIPELGVELSLTPAFRGRVTTVEGILRMMEEDSKDEKTRKELAELAEGKKKGKMVIKNRSGLLKLLDL